MSRRVCATRKGFSEESNKFCSGEKIPVQPHGNPALTVEVGGKQVLIGISDDNYSTPDYQEYIKMSNYTQEINNIIGKGFCN